MHNPILLLLAALASATLLNVVLKRINMPTVIGYILTGVIIGNGFDVQLHGNPALEQLAEFGVVFFMFTIGLEFSLSHLGEMRREVFLFGLLQVVVTALVLALGLQLALNIAFQPAILMGSGLALSSTAIVLKLLNESGRIRSDYGRNAVGILIFQDIAVIPILLMITLFTRQGSDLSSLLLQTAGNALLTLLLLVVLGRTLVRSLFRAVSALNSKEIYMGSILLTVVGSAAIAHQFGFSYSLGAFIAGMMIADTLYRYQVEADLIPFRDLLLGVFFVTVGLQIDLLLLMGNLPVLLMFGLLVMLVKGLLIFLLLVAFGPAKTAIRTALILAQVGEFALVVFSLLLGHGLLDAALAQTAMVATVLSMMLTPLLFNHLESLVQWLIPQALPTLSAAQAGAVGGRMLLCGYGSFGRLVSARLDRAGIAHLIISNNTEDYVRAKEAGKGVVFGDPADSSLLTGLHVREAMGVILALDDFGEVRQASAALHLIDPQLKVIAKVQTEEQRESLREFNQELLLDGNTQAAETLVVEISRSRLLAQETAKLQYLQEDSLKAPQQAIEQIRQEQARLLEVMTASFEGLRQGQEILRIKALHDSFQVLSEIIAEAIQQLMRQAQLASGSYERLNLLLSNQHQLTAMNQALEQLGQALRALEQMESTRQLAATAVEGLDALLLMLIDLSREYSPVDGELLRQMTAGEGAGLSALRQRYLQSQQPLPGETNALLFSAINQMERLKLLFGGVAENYRRLAEG